MPRSEAAEQERRAYGLLYPFDIDRDRMGHDWHEALAKALRMAEHTGQRYVIRRKTAGWGAGRWWAAQQVRHPATADKGEHAAGEEER